MSKTLQEEQQPIDSGIVKALIQSIPKFWNEAILEATCQADESGGEKLTILIASPEGYKHYVEITSSLTGELRKLSLLFARHGKPWSKVTYRIVNAGMQGWRFRGDFIY